MRCVVLSFKARIERDAGANVSRLKKCEVMFLGSWLGMLIAQRVGRLEFPSLKSKLMKGTSNGTA